MQYDVFNGDADGIFALHQLRLAIPVEDAELITGVKRDIALLKRIDTVSSAAITVLDISLDKNRESLTDLLRRNNTILYIDHHFAGDIPASAALEHHIEPSAETCTSLIINHLLEGRYTRWAICGAFGDNLHEQANLLAIEAGIGQEELDILQKIGELFNYNGYGARLEDLHFHPAELYRAVRPYADPLHFISATDLVARLRNGYEEDMSRAMEQKCIDESGDNRLYRFPAASWSRRVAGVFSNMKAREKKDAAHALIVENTDGTLQISVRAPLTNRKNADILCRSFPTGGGRSAAAGINNLPADMLHEFITAFNSMYRHEDDSSDKTT